MTRTRPRHRGFTLIEVLATLVLMAIALPAVMRAATVALSAASTARHTTEAASLGEAKLNELIALNEWNQNGSGDFSPDHTDYRWTVETAARDLGVYDVRMNVIWQEAGKERKLTIATLAYQTSTTTGGLP